MKILILLIFCTLPLLGAAKYNQEAFEKEIKPFLEEHCIRCHGKDKQKGERRFDQLKFDMKDSEVLYQFEEILDQLNLGEMPPKNKPKQAIMKAKIDWLTGMLLSAQASKMKGKTVMRRLTRFEYSNTVKDLLGLRSSSFDPADKLPPEALEDGFDNNGESLSISDFHLNQFIDAAFRSLDKALYFRAKPKTEKVVYTGKDFSGANKYTRGTIKWFLKKEDYIDYGHGGYDSYRLVTEEAKGVAEDGFYKIRVKANALNRFNYDEKTLRFNKDEKMIMRFMAASPKYGKVNQHNTTEVELASFEMEDNKEKYYEATVWIDKGYVPMIHYKNGPSPIKGVIEKIAKKYHKDIKTGADPLKPSRNKDLQKATGKLISDVYKGPVIRVFSMEVNGPLNKAWPPLSHRTVIGSTTDIEKVDFKKVLAKFVNRAFRRPASESEVDKFLALINRRIHLGDKKEDALKTGLAAVLTSPKFLYMKEQDDKLSQFDLASRMSFYFWSSIPDNELLSLAWQGKLKDKKVLLAQAERMLNDPKSKAFVDHFTDSWLHLNTLGDMPPDQVKFKTYYTDFLEASMKTETKMFFNYVLRGNKAVSEFIDSRVTFLNERLAKHYKIPGVKGNSFRKVNLEDKNRGGLLGHASILTLTSNGVETSPVIRGIWVLENILGTPPSPPPPDVEPLEPDTRGAKTVRELLAKHRQVETCNACHQKIDPIGFTLENYDPIGAWRSKYKKSGINALGSLPSGEKMDGFQGLKNTLLGKKDMLLTCLTKKLLTYATGRKMTFKDQPEINRIVAKIKSQGYGFKDLVLETIVSKSFLNK